MIHADAILHGPTTESTTGKFWTAARPIPGPFIERIRDAWLVLTGRCEAVIFEKDLR